MPPSRRFEVTQFQPVNADVARPFWSVMVPTFNRDELLARTLRSLLAADPGPELMQIEVVDNASEKVDVRRLVHEIGHGRIDYFRQERNIGAFPNFDTCINRSRGHWVHILSDDDLVLPDFYTSLQTDLAAVPEAGMAVTGVMFIDADDRPTGAMPAVCRTPGLIPNWLEQIAVMQRQQVVGTVVRREAYEAVGGFRLDVQSAADWEMWIRIAARFAVWGTPEIKAGFRMHAGSWSSETYRKALNTRDLRLVIEGVRDYLPADSANRLSESALTHYAVGGIGMARQFAQNGELTGALSQLRESLLCSQSAPVLQAVAGLAMDLQAYAGALTAQFQQIQQRPHDPSPRAVVRGVRRELAEAWLDMPDEQIESSHATAIGQIQSVFLQHRIHLEPPEEMDQPILDRLAVLPVDSGSRAARRCLVTMLYHLPCTLLEIAPEWLRRAHGEFLSPGSSPP